MPPLLYQIRALFINPHFRPPPPPNYGRIFRNTFTFMRKRFFVVLMFTIFSVFILGFLVTTGAVLDIYADFGIRSTFDRPEGLFWDFLWWFRGQPAGFESNPDAIVFWEAVHKIDLAATLGDVRGINGPLTWWGLLTEWFVDLTIYAPKFLDLGWLTVNLDLAIPFAIKIAFDIAILMVMILLMIPLTAVIAFLLPWMMMFAWRLMGPVLRIIVLASPLWIAVLYGFYSPELFADQFGMIINLTTHGGLVKWVTS